ncbi:MAG TPA: methyltransferase domain-containing protein [Chloroflexia bacterium]|nr:methyltransferase domain-containing protein [Chloroflexia bacterium]
MHTVHGHGHRHGNKHTHTHKDPAPTEGRLIRWARFYDPLIWLKLLGQTHKLRTLPLDLANIRLGERVLDVGCGTGDVTLAAARRVGHGGTVYGIDASPEMIDVARSKARRRRLPAQFLVEPVEALSFDDGSFDVVLSSLMMHHLPRELRRRALAEIRRVLRPGGRVVIVDLQAMSRSPRPWEPGWLVTRLHKLGTSPPAEVQASIEARAALLSEAGFHAIKSGSTRYSWLGYALGRKPSVESQEGLSPSER